MRILDGTPGKRPDSIRIPCKFPVSREIRAQPKRVMLPRETAPGNRADTGMGGGAVRRMRTSLRFPYPAIISRSEKAAPLGKSGGAGLLVVVAGLKVALRRKVVVDRGMD